MKETPDAQHTSGTVSRRLFVAPSDAEAPAGWICIGTINFDLDVLFPVRTSLPPHRFSNVQIIRPQATDDE